MRNQLTLLYNSDNQMDAQQIIDDLSGYNIDITSYTEKDFGYNLLELCESVQTPVLLLLSHNWLTCSACLYNALPGLKILKEKKQLFLTLVDAVVTDNGVVKRERTEIDKVRDVIPYMKYWQEAFLEARYNRINSATSENIESEKATKAVSLNLGDLLNFFRPIHHPYLKTLRGSNYQPVFDYFNFTVERVEIQDSLPVSPTTPKEIPEANLHREIEEPLPVQSNHASGPTIEDFDIPYAPELEDSKTTATSLAQKEESPEVELMPSQEEIPQTISSPTTEKNTEIELMPTSTNPTSVPPDKPLEEEHQIASDTKKHPEVTEPTVASPDKTVQEETINELSNLSVDSVLEQAVQYFDEDKDDKGFQLFEKAIQNNYDDNATLRYYYAYFLAQRKSAFDEAIHQLDTILLYDPKNDNAYFLLAELAEIKENFALAKNYYLQTLQLNPDYPHINYRIGVILQDQFQGAEKEAADYLQAEIRKDPENVDAIYRLGIYYNESGENIELAKKSFLRVLELDKEHNFANYDLALIYHNQGDAFKASYYYKKGCVNNPELKTEQNDLAFLAPIENKKVQQEEKQPATSTAPIQNPDVVTKTIFITGATSGIGLATAEKFANEGGCRLILAGRRRNRLLQIKEAIAENYDIDTEILQFDVRDYVAVKEAIGSLNAPFNRIDVLINNAGLALGLSSIASGELSDWETMIDTNIKGLLYTTKEVAPMMIAQNGGQIINIGSIAGKEAYPNGNVYNATKAAVEILTKAMRLDLHKYNIRVGQVAPGHVETEFALNRFHGDEAKAKIYEDFTPLSARDIANIIYFMVNQPPHVNIQDVLVFPTQQASATVIHRSGRQN